MVRAASGKNHQRVNAAAAEAWRLRVQGWQQSRIAAHLGVSQQRVSQLLRATEVKLYAEFKEHALEVKARQTAQLEHAFMLAMDQWERSCGDAEKVSVTSGRTKMFDSGEAVALPDMATRTTERQTGNPALLGVALKALADIRQIWGLNAAEKTQVSGPEGGPIKIVEVELVREERIRRIAAAAGTETPDAG